MKSRTALLVVGAGLHLLGHLEELVHREDVEAALLATGHDQALRHPLAELRGEEEAALVIESGAVRTEKHRAHLPCRPVQGPHGPLVFPTLLHDYPPVRRFCQKT